MTDPWQYQIRVYLPDSIAALARTDPAATALQPLNAVLTRHDATMVSQLAAFEAYVAEADREGPAAYPLYSWTKATIDDPAMRAKHGTSFSIHVAGQEVYPSPVADALEVDLKSLAGSPLVTRMSRHDTDPAKNLPIPRQYQ